MDNGSYVAFLIIGIVLVAIDGHLIYRSAVRYLAESYSERGSATSMARLVSVFFHLVVLGVLALVSVVDISAGGQLQTVVLRLGVLLLILAAAHGVTIKILNRMRDRLDTEGLTMDRLEHRHAPAPRTPAPAPAPADGPTTPVAGHGPLSEREIKRA